MNLTSDWAEIRELFIAAQRASQHHTLATVNSDATPHVTPIGSLWLDPAEPRALYFDVLNQQLRANLDRDPQVTVMAVNGGQWNWLRAILSGRFKQHVGARLHGSVGPRREGSPEEIDRLMRPLRGLKWTRGYKAIWQNMRHVREIRFDRVKPVHLGRMTSHLS